MRVKTVPSIVIISMEFEKMGKEQEGKGGGIVDLIKLFLGGTLTPYFEIKAMCLFVCLFV